MTEDEEIANRHRRLLDEKRNVTARNSETARFIAFGLLAIYYTLISGNGDFAKSMLSLQKVLLDLMALAAVLTIVFDYAQYLLAGFSIEEALDDKKQLYVEKSCAYRGRRCAFVAKQWTAAVGALLLIIVIISTAARLGLLL
jgi:hypothetical protein